MVRAILDANVIISALIQSGIPRKIWLAFKNGRFALVISHLLFQEILITVTRPKFHNIINEFDRKEVAFFIELFAEFIEPKKTIQICRDPADNHILACGLEADLIVSGDKDIIVLKNSFPIPILTPREFMERLDKTA